MSSSYLAYVLATFSIWAHVRATTQPAFRARRRDYIEPVINLADILDLRRLGLSKLNRPEIGGDVCF